MALTAQQLALRLAKHIGVTSFDPADSSNTDSAQPALQPGDTDELVACINGALQELWDTAPSSVRLSRLNVELRAPAALALTVTHGGKAIAAFPDYAAWMDGCTIRFETGEENEIVSGSALLRPYCGPTAAEGTEVAATLYADCVTAGPEVIAVLDPMEARDLCGASGRLLPRAASRGQFESWWGLGARKTGFPEVCFVETGYFSGAAGPMGIRLRVHPMPLEALILVYGACLNVLAISAADLGTDSDPGTVLPIPGDWEESVLLPLALQRLSVHPRFKPQDAKTEIARQAAMARRMITRIDPVPNSAGERLMPVFR